MATLIAETKWHGNPRPELAYASSIYDETVASPYYLDGRDVPVYLHTVTSFPITDLVADATIDVAGPLATVEFTLSGIWTAGTALDITIVRTTAPDYVATITAPAGGTFDEMAVYVATQISKELDMVAVASIGGVVGVTAVAPVTALTITVLTVT
jgi:hypothetical protein